MTHDADRVDAARSMAERSEERRRGVRLVEYTPYPRADRAGGFGNEPRLALATNRSRRGLCIDTSERLEVGSLLRVIECGVDGAPMRESLARVAWRSCSRTQRGRFTAGLARIDDDAMHDVPVGHRSRRSEVAISA